MHLARLIPRPVDEALGRMRGEQRYETRNGIEI